MPGCSLLITTYYFKDQNTPSKHRTFEHAFYWIRNIKDSEFSSLQAPMSRNVMFIFSSWFLLSWENKTRKISEISPLIKIKPSTQCRSQIRTSPMKTPCFVRGSLVLSRNLKYRWLWNLGAISEGFLRKWEVTATCNWMNVIMAITSLFLTEASVKAM